MSRQPILLGTSNFAKLMRSGGAFADNSLFVKAIIEDSNETVLITRPRRWGKTLNLSMLQHFLSSEVDGESTQGLFNTLTIAQVDQGTFLNKHQGRYPVIFVSFKDVKEDSFASAYQNIAELMSALYTEHSMLLKSNKLSLSDKKKFEAVLNGTFAEYFGFVDEELDTLFANQGLSKDEARVKTWYNGYLVGGLTLYNAWSIMNSLKNDGKLGPYWVNTASDTLLKTLLQEASIENKTLFQSLLTGDSIEVAVTERMRFDQVNEDNGMLWTLLLFSGYLTVMTAIPERSIYRCQLAIPNEEVKSIYESIFLNWLKIDSPAIQM